MLLSDVHCGIWCNTNGKTSEEPPACTKKLFATFEIVTEKYMRLGKEMPIIIKTLAKIGIENAEGKYNDYVDLIRSIKNPQIGATIDVGHCVYFEEIKTIQNLDKKAEKLNETILSLIKELEEEVYHFHLHNVRKFEDVDFSKIPHPYWKKGEIVDHRCVPEGLIDFREIFSLIKEIGYRELFDVELEEPEKEEKARKSGKYLTKLLGGQKANEAVSNS